MSEEPQTRWVDVLSLPDEPGPRALVVSAVARELRVPLADVGAALGHLPLMLPGPLPSERAAELVTQLSRLGARATLRDAPLVKHPCGAHPMFHAEHTCADCSARTCTLCAPDPNARRCLACQQRRGRKQRNSRIRIGILLTILAVVVAGVVGRELQLQSRHRWERPLVVVVIPVGASELPRAQLERLRLELSRLGTVLTAEASRHRGAPLRPFDFYVSPQVVSAYRPTFPEPGASLAARAQLAMALSRELSGLETPGTARVAGDIRVYVFAQPATDAPHFVEGVSNEQDDFALIEAVLTEDMAVMTAMAIAHESLHCVGATDKYDEDGHARVPAGLVDSAHAPLFPQARAEIMVGELPLGPGAGRNPSSVDEVGVGDLTASEVGWRR